MIDKPHELSDYDQGFIDGLTAFAHWQEGYQYVGTGGILLSTAIKQRLEIWNYHPTEVKK